MITFSETINFPTHCFINSCLQFGKGNSRKSPENTLRETLIKANSTPLKS